MAGHAVFKGQGDTIVNENACPAILIAKEWDNLQQRLAIRREGQHRGRTDSSAYLLSGVLRCGHCQKAMAGAVRGVHRLKYDAFSCGRTAPPHWCQGPWYSHPGHEGCVCQPKNHPPFGVAMVSRCSLRNDPTRGGRGVQVPGCASCPLEAGPPAGLLRRLPTNLPPAPPASKAETLVEPRPPPTARSP